MSLIKCQDCSTKYSYELQSCPNCGCPTNYNLKKQKDINHSENRQYNKKNDNSVKIFLGIIIMVVFIYFGYSYLELQSKIENMRIRTEGIQSEKENLKAEIQNLNSKIENLKSEKAIIIAKNHKISSSVTFDQQVKNWVENDEDIVKIYGWEAKKAQDDVYFVAYTFDEEDTTKDTGYRFYWCEVSINDEKAILPEDTTNLREKYIELGFISSD